MSRTRTRKHPGGRPTAYKPEYAKEAYEYCAIFGADDKMLAKKFGVAESTLYLWKLKHNEFSEALKRGKDAFDTQHVEKSLLKRAMGYTLDGKHYPPDTTACIFWLKNRQPRKWRDKQELEHTGELKINIVNYGDTDGPI
jgi:transposase-like protein